MKQQNDAGEYNKLHYDNNNEISICRLTDGSTLTLKLISTECFAVYADGSVRKSNMYSVSSQLSNGSDSYEELVKDVTHNADTAHRLFDAITEGHVTPCTLKDIVEDFIYD